MVTLGESENSIAHLFDQLLAAPFLIRPKRITVSIVLSFLVGEFHFLNACGQSPKLFKLQFDPAHKVIKETLTEHQLYTLLIGFVAFVHVSELKNKIESGSRLL